MQGGLVGVGRLGALLTGVRRSIRFSDRGVKSETPDQRTIYSYEFDLGLSRRIDLVATQDDKNFAIRQLSFVVVWRPVRENSRR